MTRALKDLVRDLTFAVIATGQPTDRTRELVARAELALRPPERAARRRARRAVGQEPVKFLAIVGDVKAGDLAFTKPIDLAALKIEDVARQAATKLVPQQEDPRRWSKTCSAICAESGKRCALPAHSAGTAHAYGRTKFTRVAAPGQTFFPKAAELEARAHNRPSNAMQQGGV